jgi:hypothetical protein
MKAEDIAEKMWATHGRSQWDNPECKTMVGLHAEFIGIIKEAIELHEQSKPKLTDERIAEVSSRFVEWRDSYLIIPESAIDNFARAIEAEVQRQDEQSKWKYPAKGELPEEGKNVLFCVRGTLMLGRRMDDRMYEGGISDDWYYLSKIEKWQYAPEVE